MREETRTLFAQTVRVSGSASGRPGAEPSARDRAAGGARHFLGSYLVGFFFQLIRKLRKRCAPLFIVGERSKITALTSAPPEPVFLFPHEGAQFTWVISVPGISPR